jgi:hypothetical protein
MTVLRRVQGITYWVIDDVKEIRTFVNSNLREEWERDNQKDEVDSSTDNWLISLPRREWHLRNILTDSVNLDPSTMTREDFKARLEERSKELRRCITEYHSVIWPVVVRGEDYQLKDGYCRYAALRKLGVNKVMAYVGTLK